MTPPMQTTQRLIQQFQKGHGIPLRLRTPRFWSKDFDAYYDVSTKQLMLPRRARGSLLREFIYHELGHALIDQYRVPLRLLSLFVAESPGLKRSKAIELMGEDVAAPEGWVSWYAMVNGTEDFCEVLAGYASNGYRRKGQWQFSGFTFDVTHDRLLQRKIDWVEEILAVCGEQAA